jgi:peptidyl-prolyl cis-trans isomerase C
MRHLRRRVVALALGASLLCARADTRAEDAGSADDRRARVVARVGPAEAITVGALEDRLAAVSPFQRASFGVDADAVRRRFLAEVLVPESLFALGAREQKLAAQPRPAYGIERALSNATLRALRDRLGPAAAIPMQDVQRYYDENRARYDTPERYQIWRILCKTRDEAQSVLDQAKRDPTPKTFGELAREHSLDKATYLREGNLGFVTLAGGSNEPGLQADPAVVRAAQGVRDGELVPAPVAEGEYFSVVWRRGTISANRRTVDDVAASIRDTIAKARVKEGTDKLVAGLRAAKVRDLDESPLDTLDVPTLTRDR